MRLAYLLICLLVIAAGALFGALNPQPVQIDLYYSRFELRLGLGLLIGCLVGALVGGFCVWAGVVLPLRRRLGRLRRDTAALQRAEPATVPDEPIA